MIAYYYDGRHHFNLKLAAPVVFTTGLGGVLLPLLLVLASSSSPDAVETPAWYVLVFRLYWQLRPGASADSNS